MDAVSKRSYQKLFFKLTFDAIPQIWHFPKNVWNTKCLKNYDICLGKNSTYILTKKCIVKKQRSLCAFACEVHLSITHWPLYLPFHLQLEKLKCFWRLLLKPQNFSFWKGGTLFFPFEVELGQSTEYLNFGPNLIINQVEGGRGATFMKNGIYEQISWDNKAPSKYRHNMGCKNFKLGLSTDLGVYFTYHSHCCPPLEYSHLLPWLLTWQPFSQVDPVRFRLCS